MGKERLQGIDIARGIAIIFMVIIHATNRFQLAITSREGIEVAYHGLYQFLQGRGAALFLVLAGVGLSIQVARRQDIAQLRSELLRRGLFLLVFGAIHRIFYSGDILHIMGIMTLIAVPLLQVSSRWLLATAAALTLAVPIICNLVDFHAHWVLKEVLVGAGFGDIARTSSTITYSSEVFWTLPGFFRHTIFEGLYALVPNFALMLVGIILGRQRLNDSKQLKELIAYSGLALLATLVVDAVFQNQWLQIDILPHTPLYVASAISSSVLIISLCQRLAKGAALGQVGRLAFTVYISHVIVLATLALAVRTIWPQRFLLYPFWVPVAATLLYMLLAMVYSGWHFRRYQRGPLEHLMRTVVKGRMLINKIR